ncbi:putative bifunctional diguanylate cyclase/phosphodiesterase [Pengzhenrongella frigida]|uniref:putative bifunctional diguanylate cyclase/phosphodiesterase n=1 Tax=Pengzhenrongella frigida TaxID=1259133 RepID=UPI0013EC4793|nr:GGDEF domain-containing protein [Cellulomonas sp. HLT2-17]
MVHKDSLSLVLSEFARTLLTDFPVQEILQHLVERIVEVLPVTGAGVTLVGPGLTQRYIAASNQAAPEVEQLQSDLGEGPCLTVFRTGEPVAVPFVAADDRYPAFGPAAITAGVRAVFAFPLRHDGGSLGALALYRDAEGPLTSDTGDAAEAAEAAQTLADVAAAYLLNAQARERAQHAADWYRDRALHDALTGLPNRVLLQERIDQAARRARRSQSLAAVLFIDLDNFKRVNDAYGHHVGDELLVAVANRLSLLVRTGDTLARVSGDEFVFLCEDLADPADVDVLVQRIDAAFELPFAVSSGELVASAGIGIAFSGPGRTVSDHLVLDADMAKYQAKRQGGGAHQTIDLRAAEEDHQRNALEQELRAAGSRGQLSLVYQPIVRMVDGSVVGAEALLRWTHPDQGAVPAATAIAVAERSGQITQVGEWVLARACRDWVAWHRRHPGRRLDLSVNVSARQLMAPQLPAAVARVLATAGMDPAALVLEVTEGVILEDNGRGMRVLHDLKTLGVRLALDDFGTGYCSLSYLQRFPVDIVKIDQTFVVGMGQDAVTSTIVSAVTRLAHELGMTVTAEGVETEAQCHEMREVGCDLAQGYLFAHPMSARDLVVRLA